jgi:RND family efflux transporter MFP subunit
MKPTLLFLILALVVIATGCSRSPAPAADSQKETWTCAMHPSYVSDKPGDCPICGMKLVRSGVPAPPAQGGERRLLFYRNPMNPADTSPVPKKDSMGMDYVAIYSDEGSASSVSGMAVANIDPERRRLMGLKTQDVRRGPLDTTIRTTGRVTFDETRVAKVQPRFEGFIETLNANFSGKSVKRGEVLATIYSPELLATEQEYLLAAKSREALSRAGLPDSAEASRARLHLYGIDDGTLDDIERRGKPLRAVPLRAPISGYVTAKNVVAGAKVGPDDALFDISDYSRVWVLADVYEYELPRVHVGDRAKVTLSYWPDREWKGRISYIFPTVDEKTRTIKVRIEVENPKLELKPEMFAEVVLSENSREALLVPEDAIIESGTRKIVFVALGEGRLQPREITTGDHGGGMAEVRSGLTSGEVVATGANFLLDSESRLKSAVTQLGAAPSPPPDHSGHGGHP